MELTLTAAETVVALAGFVLAALLAYWQHRERAAGLREALFATRIAAAMELADLFTQAYFFVDQARRLTLDGQDATKLAATTRYEVMHVYRKHSILFDQRTLQPLLDFIGSWHQALKPALEGEAYGAADERMYSDYRLVIAALRTCIGLDQLVGSLEDVLRKLPALPSSGADGA